MIGTAKTSVKPAAMRTNTIGLSLTRSSTTASQAPASAKIHAVARIAAFDHVAKLGRDRGRSSPIPDSPAMATLTGRMKASGNVCTAIACSEAPMAAPTIAYWTRRAASAPAISPATAADAPKASEKATVPRTRAARAIT